MTETVIVREYSMSENGGEDNLGTRRPMINGPFMMDREIKKLEADVEKRRKAILASKLGDREKVDQLKALEAEYETKKNKIARRYVALA